MDNLEATWIRMQTGKTLFVLFSKEFKRHREFLTFRPWTSTYEWMPSSFIRDSKELTPSKEQLRRSIHIIFSPKVIKLLKDE